MKPVRQIPPTTIVFLGLQHKMVDLEDFQANTSEINCKVHLKCGKRSRMPVRIVSVIANCESSPSVKSIAKKRIAHRVGNGNLVVKVIEVIKVNEVITVIKVIVVIKIIKGNLVTRSG